MIWLLIVVFFSNQACLEAVIQNCTNAEGNEQQYGNFWQPETHQIDLFEQTGMEQNRILAQHQRSVVVQSRFMLPQLDQNVQLQPELVDQNQLFAQFQSDSDNQNQIFTQFQPESDNQNQLFAQLQPGSSDHNQIFTQFQPESDNQNQLFAQLQPGSSDHNQIFTQLQPDSNDQTQLFAQLQPESSDQNQIFMQKFQAQINQIPVVGQPIQPPAELQLNENVVYQWVQPEQNASLSRKIGVIDDNQSHFEKIASSKEQIFTKCCCPSIKNNSNDKLPVKKSTGQIQYIRFEDLPECHCGPNIPGSSSGTLAQTFTMPNSDQTIPKRRRSSWKRIPRKCNGGKCCLGGLPINPSPETRKILIAFIIKRPHIGEYKVTVKCKTEGMTSSDHRSVMMLVAPAVDRTSGTGKTFKGVVCPYERLADCVSDIVVSIESGDVTKSFRHDKPFENKNTAYFYSFNKHTMDYITGVCPGYLVE